MSARKKNIILTMSIIIVGLLLAKVFSNQKEGLHRHAKPQAQKAVKTMKVEQRTIVPKIETSGRLTALNKIEVYAEVSGILEAESIQFKEGNAFKKGQSLVKIDDTVYKNNLLAQKSSLLNQLTLLLPDFKIDFPNTSAKWEKYLATFELNAEIRELPKAESEQEKYYIASRNIYNLYYNIKSMEATLVKYDLQAPFSGMVTMSNINPGTLVRAGQKLGEFTNFSVFELEAAVGISDANRLQKGMEVELTSADIGGLFPGRVVRINRSIDPQSQSVKVFIQSTDDRLKDGMYLTAHIRVDRMNGIVQLPRNVLVGHSQVYVVQNNHLQLKDVEIIDDDNDLVFVKGLSDGQKILSEHLPEMYDGMKLKNETMN